MYAELSDRARAATGAVTRAMDLCNISGEVSLLRENDNLVFEVGDHVVAKVATGLSRQDMAHEAAFLTTVRGAGLPIVRTAGDQEAPIDVGSWSVLFMERLDATGSSAPISLVLEALEAFIVAYGKRRLPWSYLTGHIFR